MLHPCAARVGLARRMSRYSLPSTHNFRAPRLPPRGTLDQHVDRAALRSRAQAFTLYGSAVSFLPTLKKTLWTPQSPESTTLAQRPFLPRFEITLEIRYNAMYNVTNLPIQHHKSSKVCAAIPFPLFHPHCISTRYNKLLETPATPRKQSSPPTSTRYKIEGSTQLSWRLFRTNWWDPHPQSQPFPESPVSRKIPRTR